MSRETPYHHAVARATAAIVKAQTRQQAVDAIIEIADEVRKRDPLFLYREFFADIGVSDWDEFRVEEMKDE